MDIYEYNVCTYIHDTCMYIYIINVLYDNNWKEILFLKYLIKIYMESKPYFPNKKISAR